MSRRKPLQFGAALLTYAKASWGEISGRPALGLENGQFCRGPVHLAQGLASAVTPGTGAVRKRLNDHLNGSAPGLPGRRRRAVKGMATCNMYVILLILRWLLDRSPRGMKVLQAVEPGGRMRGIRCDGEAWGAWRRLMELACVPSPPAQRTAPPYGVTWRTRDHASTRSPATTAGRAGHPVDTVPAATSWFRRLLRR